MKSSMTPLRALIVAAARSCVGTKFEKQGRRPGMGLDCWGVIKAAGEFSGHLIGDVEAYPLIMPRFLIHPHMGGLLDTYFLRVPVLYRKPGDVLVFDTGRKREYLGHVGIMTPYGVVHANTTAERCAEHVLDDFHTKRIKRVYQFPGVTNGDHCICDCR